MSDTLKEIAQWFEITKPEPTVSGLCTQIGGHYEEAAEMARLGSAAKKSRKI